MAGAARKVCVEPTSTPRAASYPEAGAVLIVSRHVGGDTVAPAVVGWQVVRLAADGEHFEVGVMHTRRMAAREFAVASFPNIVGWQKLSATVLAAQVQIRIEIAPAPVVVPPRRHPNGLRIPMWRA